MAWNRAGDKTADPGGVCPASVQPAREGAPLGASTHKARLETAGAVQNVSPATCGFGARADCAGEGAHHDAAPELPEGHHPGQTRHMPSTGEARGGNSPQALWPVQPYNTMPSWAQVRAYSRRAGHEHARPCVHVHKVFSHRATKGSGSTRGWQRANTEALFSSWHCSHRACRERSTSARLAGGPGRCPALAVSGEAPRTLSPTGQTKDTPESPGACVAPSRC